MKGKQIVAIDVGSSNVVIAVGMVEDDGKVDIRGIVSEPVQGVAAGHIDNSEQVGQAVAAAKQRIEQQLNIRITEAYAGLSGDYIRSVQVKDHVYVQDELRNGTNQITQRDLDELGRRMKSVKLPDEREEIITMEPLRYEVDDKEVEIPVGAYGYRLSAIYNYILCDKSMRARLGLCLQRQGIAVKEYVPNAFVQYLAVANSEDMQEGVVVVDLGGGVTDVTVIYGGKVRYIASIPLGVDAINSDIRSSSIPSNYVEDLKVQYGAAIADMALDDNIVFQSARRGMVKSILRRNLATIIEARLMDITDWVKREIKEAGCGSKFVPSVILTGGGSKMRFIEELFQRELGLEDVHAVHPEYGLVEESMYEHITTPAYATVVSLLLYGAKKGGCTVVAGGATVRPTVQPEPVPVRPTTPIEEADFVPEDSDKPTPGSTSESTAGEDIKDGVIEGEDIDDKPRGIKNIFSNIFGKVSKTFAESDDDEFKL